MSAEARALCLVRVLDSERDTFIRRTFPDGLVPVAPEPELCITPRKPEPELCWMVDLDRLEMAQLRLMAGVISERFGELVTAVDLLEVGVPIPVEDTLMVEVES